MDIQEETKVKATKEEADAYYDGMDGRSNDGPLLTAVDRPLPNFVSDLFFLLNAYQHFGLAKTIGNRTTAERNLSDIEKELKRAEASRGDWHGVSNISRIALIAESRNARARRGNRQETQGEHPSFHH